MPYANTQTLAISSACQHCVDCLAGDFHVGDNSTAKDMRIDGGVTTYLDFHPRPYQIPDIGADEFWPLGALKFIYLPFVVR